MLIDLLDSAFGILSIDRRCISFECDGGKFRDGAGEVVGSLLVAFYD
ncbi:hypothetical protein ACFQZO_15755 [Bradyrhizobium sp. GCM10027634]|nr:MULTISPECIES: hypothetical protein [Bradyrhizobium]MDN4985436.1 hypothetical protein [Bradyrhizobium sp. WYCCWR 13022]MDN5002332.1 hypothetical protein [Bradyrhizobium sp. WYCCWR 12677]